jgi:amino acid adenylation domain-containing protein
VNAVPQLHDFLLETAQAKPSAEALTCQGKRLTYQEIDQRSNALAHGLIRRGVQRGDRVMVFAENSPDAAVAFWGVLKANAVVSMVNPLTRGDKLAFLLNDCRATALIAARGLWRVVQEAVPKAPSVKLLVASGDETFPGVDVTLPGLIALKDLETGEPKTSPPPRKNLDIDRASLIYTSGSTGEPKAVMLTHRNMLTAATSISTYLELVPSDVILGVLPLAFDYGLYQLIMATRVGARLVLERDFAFPAQVIARVIEEKVTVFPGVPTLFARMAEMKSLDPTTFSHVRAVTNTAAALHLKHIEHLKRTFPTAKIFSMYGLTECKRCTYLPPKDLDTKPTSVGIAIPNTELWLVDENDRRLGPNQVGQLVIRGATVMRGYWERPEETKKKLRPGPLPGEMVLYTGDLCRLDEDGYLTFIGRMDDIIKSRGEKVAPKEVENVIVDVPGVKEAAVIGVPDEVLGQAVKAYVVLEQGAQVQERDVIKACQKRLESFMVPRTVVFVAELPTTDTGKIKKSGLT